ncbi:MAG: cobalamin biosynthesis protein, partial [Pseudomonadota bacterium]
PLKYFTAKDISCVQSPSPESKHALQVMGVHGVAEPCAILGSGGGTLLRHKVKLKNMTLAVAAIPLKQIIEDSMVDYG